MGGTKRLLVIISKVVISLLMVSRGIIPFEKTYCGSRDYQQQHAIKEKNSRWGFTIIKQVGDPAWPQIHIHSLCSHGPGYWAPFQLTVCTNSVGICAHQMNKYLSHTYISKNTLKTSKSYIQEHKRNTRKPTKEEVMILHEIIRPNSLKTVPSGVTNCRNLPFGGRAKRGSRVCLPREEGARSCHQHLFEENVRKTEKGVVYEL